MWNLINIFKGRCESMNLTIPLSMKEAVATSGLGLLVVFLALIALALMIIIFSKIFAKLSLVIGEDETTAKGVGTANSGAKATVQPKNDNNDLELVSAIIAAVTEEAYSSMKNVTVTSIKEIN
jgi:sodium pump decarboxylase gamma subunit